MGIKVIVTAGPTNERIDDVMKITNMSTGSLGKTVAEELLSGAARDIIDKVYYISPKLAKKPEGPYLNSYYRRLELIEIESAEQLKAELIRLLTENHIDAVVHSAAVGDYKSRYSVRGEDLAREIAVQVMEAYDDDLLDENRVYNIIMSVLESPECAADDSGKMSSYEPNLMTMMDLTPKVIGCVKETSPDTLLIGFKLLDGVAEEHLLHVAAKLRDTNKADYIVANDLSRIGNGGHWAMLVGDGGKKLAEYHSKLEIAQGIHDIIYSRFSN